MEAALFGLDIPEQAVRYANEAGLHSAGVVANLDADELSPSDATLISAADVVLSTGAIGYVTGRTYGKLLDAITGSPWIISFVLRMFPYQGFIDDFARRGLVTERLTSATFVQRRFRDGTEFEMCHAALRAQGIDPDGLESDGLLQAELFLSRPGADAEAAPLDEIVTVSSGRFNQFGCRFVQIQDEGGLRIAVEA
jgi:hypothetical protein